MDYLVFSKQMITIKKTSVNNFDGCLFTQNTPRRTCPIHKVESIHFFIYITGPHCYVDPCSRMHVTCRLFADWSRPPQVQGDLKRYWKIKDTEYSAQFRIYYFIYIYIYASRGRCTMELQSPLSYYTECTSRYVLKSAETRDMVCEIIIKTRGYFDSDTKPSDNKCKKDGKK